MDVISGRYSLTVFLIGEEEHDFKLEVPFSGLLNENEFEGSFGLDGERQYLQVFLDAKEILITSETMERKSTLRFNILEMNGIHSVIDARNEVKIGHDLKLLFYEYNNTHFVVEYTRLFGGSEESRNIIEVIFNVQN